MCSRNEGRNNGKKKRKEKKIGKCVIISILRRENLSVWLGKEEGSFSFEILISDVNSSAAEPEPSMNRNETK